MGPHQWPSEKKSQTGLVGASWLTQRWREMDSNHRYLDDKLPLREGLFFASVTVPVPESDSFFRDRGRRVRISKDPMGVRLATVAL